MRRRLLLPFVAAAALALPAAPAQAAEIYLTTNGDLTAYGEAGGSITFPSRYQLKLANLWANDYCGPEGGDGRGIYLRAKVWLRGADGWDVKNLGVVAYDNNGGCGNTPMEFAGKTYSFTRQVRYVEMRLCEENRPSTSCLRYNQRTYRNPAFY